MRFWAFPSPGYVFLLSVVWLLTLVHFIGWVTADERAKPAFAILGFVFLMIAQRVMLDRAKAAFGEVLQGNFDAFNIWPEVELPDLMDSFRSGGQGRGDKSRTIVEQCLAFAKPILSHAATPPHKLKIIGGTALEIDFPTQTASGYDVRVEVKNSKITVWAGKLAYIDCTIRGDINESVEWCWGHVRELLSDNCRLRELHVDERPAWACVDCRDSRGGWVEMDTFVCRGSKPSGAYVEKCFVNDLMARKS